jgi:hypothetical protein
LQLIAIKLVLVYGFIPDQLIFGPIVLQLIGIDCPPQLLSCYDFVAFASDVLAVIPETSYSFIQRLARAYSVRSGKSYSDCLSICCRRICFSIRLGVARQLTSSKMFLNNLFEDTLKLDGQF